MMDEDEDYEALFFAECGELLGDLQTHLDALLDGDSDPETVNAAFRAVHSTKGGAAAFGFDTLIAFAHAFETVMDHIRCDRLAPTAEVCQILLRAGDALESLVERARDGDGGGEETVARIRHELEELHAVAIGEPPPPPPEDADGAAATAGGAAPAGPEEAASTDGEAGSDADPGAGAEEAAPRAVRLRFAPGPDFFVRGHDPLRVFRDARRIDLVSVDAEGEVPPLESLDPDLCPFAWTLLFETARPARELLDWFSVYDGTAEVLLIDDEADEAAASPPPPAAPARPAPRATAPAPGPQATASEHAGAHPGGEATHGPRGGPAKTLRVELTRIDRLVNLVGEIVITQAALAQRLAESEAAASLEVGHSVEAMSRQTRELQESVMAIRAQPVKSVFSRMPRVVRDLADTLDKDARLVVSGEHTEVDTTVIEELAEPLTHMLRNSMDHGIESPERREALGKPRTGTIRLSAEHRGERVIIVVEDDGKGIDRERVLQKAIDQGLVGPDETPSPEEIDQLIFHPGFSTAKEISSVSGRGVGMDVVKKKILALGGRCHLSSEPGRGTRFTITLPLTLAVLDGMTIVVGGERFILPLSSVIEALRLDGCKVERMPDASRVLTLRGSYLRLLSLRDVMELPHADGVTGEEMAIVVDSETSGPVAILVDELIGQRQVVLKSLEANYRRVDGVSGATILGDGRVALILDVPSLVAMGGGAMRGFMQQETFH